MSELAIVTGVPGWLGSRLARVLANGLPEVPALAEPYCETVRCLALPGSDTDAPNVVRGDLTRPESLDPLFEGAEGATVFHVAGGVHPTRGRKELYAVNVEGTREMLTRATRAGVQRFVYVSSNSPIGVSRDPTVRFDESSPYVPYMHYGRSKMLAEQLVDAAELDTVIIRPPWFYGPDQPARQVLFFEMIRSGRVPLVGSGENRRSMAYIDNICQGLLLAGRSPAAVGQTYWIADERPYSMNEIIETIEEVMERDFGIAVARKRMRLPGLASEVALAIDKAVQGLGLYHQKIHVLSEMNKTIACSIDKAAEQLGYAPTVALEEGMRRSIASAIERGELSP